MATMKAVAQTEYGGPQVLKVLDVEKPTPGPRDLLVKIHATALNPVDTKKRKNRGQPAPPLPSPLILGYDGSGVVEEVGREVTLFKPGDEVYFAGVINRNGTNAEYTAVDERIVGHKPKTLSHIEAAAVPLTALTAWEGLFEAMHLSRDESSNAHKSLLVVAGAGGVGSIVIQLAKKVLKIGRVIGTASRPESANFVKEMGADEVINHANDLSEELSKIGLNGVDYIFNCWEPDPIFDTMVKILNPFGYIVNILSINQKVDINPLFSKRGTVTFELMFARPLFGVEPERQGALLNEVAELLDSHVLTSRATTVMPLSKIAEAHQLQESGRVIGKIVFPLQFD